MEQSTLQSLVALVNSTKKELITIKELMVEEGALHYELAEPMTAIGKLNFRKLNYTLNEIRKIDRKLKRLDNILPQLKKEVRKCISNEKTSYNNSGYIFKGRENGVNSWNWVKLIKR